MILAFRSLGFGFRYPLTVPYLQTITEYFTLRKKYVDTDAATTILGNTHKQPITIGGNPFCQKFECGKSSEVYWTYDLMVIQLEDCINIFKALHTYIYFVFIFDHPCGHDRRRENRVIQDTEESEEQCVLNDSTVLS